MDFRAEEMIVNCRDACYRGNVKNVSRCNDSARVSAATWFSVGNAPMSPGDDTDSLVGIFPTGRGFGPDRSSVLATSHNFYALIILCIGNASEVIGPLRDSLTGAVRPTTEGVL